MHSNDIQCFDIINMYILAAKPCLLINMHDITTKTIGHIFGSWAITVPYMTYLTYSCWDIVFISFLRQNQTKATLTLTILRNQSEALQILLNCIVEPLDSFVQGFALKAIHSGFGINFRTLLYYLVY